MGSHYFSLLLGKVGFFFGFHCFWELCCGFGFLYDKRQVPEDVFSPCAILNVSRITKAVAVIDPLV